jgi:hypothetical protein
MPGVCKTCGVPRLVSITQAWREGCIVDTTSGSASLCIYEASYPTALVKELEEKLGVPLDRIVYLAGTHAAVKVLGVLYESHPHIGKVLFSAPIHRMTERFLIGFGRALGVAKVDIIERKRGKGAMVEIHDPFDLSNCLAIISGVLQIADGCPINYYIHDQSGPYLVEFVPATEAESEEEAYQRLFAESLTPKKASDGRKFERCKRCGAPREVGNLLTFDPVKGFINERKDGERIIFMGVHGFNSIIRELSWELGSSVNETFIDFERRHLTARLSADQGMQAHWGEEQLYDYLALRGFGRLTDMVEKDSRTHFTVENAFVPPLVAGRLLAFWEHEHGREGAYQFDVTDSTLYFSIS